MLEQLVHSLRVKCPAGAIPDAIRVDISQPGPRRRASTSATSRLPAGRDRRSADPDTLIVHVVVRGAPRPRPPKRPPRRVTQPEVIKPERKEKEKE